MSAFTITSQTVTDLLPKRKSPPPAPKPEDPGFDRRLKDADSRLDKPRPTAEAEDTSRTRPDRDTEPRPSTTADNDTEPRDVDRSRQADASDTQPTDIDDTQQDPSADDQANGDQALEGDQQVSTDTLAVAATDQVISGVLVPDGQAAPSPVVSETVRPGTDQSTQTTATLPAQDPAATANTPASSDNQAQARAATALPTQQDKSSQPAPNQNTDPSQPSATAQRIATVAEARDGDARQAGSDDTSRQPQTALKPDAQPQQSNSSQSNAQAPLTPAATTGNPAAVGVQPAITADAAGSSNAPAQPAAPGAQAQGADNTQLNTARIARGLQNAVQQKGGAVTLRLTPPEMGTVRIQLQMHNGTVNAQFHAETQATRNLLNQQISQLRTALEQQGLSVERLGVQTMQPTTGSSLQHESQGDRDGQANDGRSRGGFTRQGDGRQQQSGSQDQPPAFDQALDHAA